MRPQGFTHPFNCHRPARIAEHGPHIMSNRTKLLGVLAATMALGGCAVPPGTFTASTQNAPLVEGPPIEDVVTSFDDALTCLRGKIPSGVVFAVGQVIDATGKETYSEGGTGKFVTQGAGEMVRSALFRAGVSVVNRRDPQISLVEANWGIRDIRRQVPVNFFVSGSINSLDSIPGGGFSAQIGGMGPRYRQNRILVAIDLTLTDAYTGRIVASVPLQKQIFTQEYGGSTNTFFGKTLVQFEAGGMEREALHFALRQMLSLATTELLGQLMQPDVFMQCRDRVEVSKGAINRTGTADQAALSAAMRNVGQEMSDEPAPALAIPVSGPDAAPVQNAAPQQAAAPATQSSQAAAQQQAQVAAAATQQTQAQKLGRLSTISATEAIRAARNSEVAANRTDAMKMAAEALQKSNDALRLLQRAAELGFNGDEGEVAAVVVQQALQAAQKAGTEAAGRESDQRRAAREAQEAATNGAGNPATSQALEVPGASQPPANSGERPVFGPVPQGGPTPDRRNMGPK